MYSDGSSAEKTFLDGRGPMAPIVNLEMILETSWSRCAFPECIIEPVIEEEGLE